jgi:hypothetical protein
VYIERTEKNERKKKNSGKTRGENARGGDSGHKKGSELGDGEVDKALPQG